jgi:hypothetical protein
MVLAHAPDPAAAPELAALERGEVVALPAAGFEILPHERLLLSPEVSDGRAKNLSYEPAAGRVGGSSLDEAGQALAAALLDRFGDWARDLVLRIAPRYAPALQRGRASLRPCEIAGRALSARKDDRRLHVDAFASRPVQGRRILRVFANVDPDGGPRVWHVGEPFEVHAARFLPWIGRPSAAAAWGREALGLTKGRRTPYDAVMLALHDLSKGDDDYQRSAPHRRMEFPAGTSWAVFTDAAVHAAISGRCALEQTFYLPVAAMAEPARSPLSILQRRLGRALA